MLAGTGGAAHGAGVGAALLRPSRLHVAARHSGPLGRPLAQLPAAAVGRSMGMGLRTGGSLSCSLKGLAAEPFSKSRSPKVSRAQQQAGRRVYTVHSGWVGCLPNSGMYSFKARTATADLVSHQQVHCVCCAQDVMYICCRTSPELAPPQREARQTASRAGGCKQTATAAAQAVQMPWLQLRLHHHLHKVRTLEPDTHRLDRACSHNHE